MFLVFVYIWLPYMILPMQASLERVPTTMLEASADLGATRAQTFRTVILPLAMPGAVSYTHLDVYKRQVLIYPMRPSARRFNTN